MFKIALKGILARKGRLLLTSLAVILGSRSWPARSSSPTRSTKSFDDLFADVFQDTDAYVRSAVVIEGDFGAGGPAADPRLADTDRGRGAGREDAPRAACSASPASSARTASPSAPKATGRPTSGPRSRSQGETIWKISEGRLARQRRRGRARHQRPPTRATSRSATR